MVLQPEIQKAFPTSEVNIRAIESSDADSLALLFANTFSSPPWNEPWTFDAARARIVPMIGTASCRGLLATAGSEVVGVAFGQIEGWLNGNLFFIQELYVSPKHQHKGIAKALLVRLATELQTVDRVDALYLLTDRGSPAESFYGKLGFAPSPKKIVLGAAVKSLASHALA